MLILFIFLNVWCQTTWEGGSGQNIWADTTKFFSKSNINYWRKPGAILLDAPNGWTSTSPTTGANHIWSVIESDIIYAGGDSSSLKGFVFKSNDYGANWIDMGLPSCNWVHDLLYSYDSILYASTDQGVYKYTGSWTLTGLNLPTNCIFQSKDSTLYAGTWNGKIYKSIDGNTWNELTVNNSARIWKIIEYDTILYACGSRIYGGDTISGIFRSYDGVNFDTTPFPHIDKVVYSICLADTIIFAGVGPDSGKVFKSLNGNVWDTTQSLIYADCVYSLIYGDNKIIYAGTGASGYLYKSSNGMSWSYEQIDPNITTIYSLMQSKEGFLFSGSNSGPGGNGRVSISGYFSSGWLKSSVYDVGVNDVNYDSVVWECDLNGGNIEVWIRTDSVPDMWGVDSIQILNSGDTIPNSFDNKRYIQYQIKFNTNSNTQSPIFYFIKIYYTIGGPSIETKSNNLCLFNVFPNPTKKFLNIKYSIKSKSKVTIAIYDISGKLIKKIIDEETAPDKYLFYYDMSNLSSGVYFIKFVTQNSEKIKKIVLLK